MNLQNARGTRDFLPEQQLLRQRIADTLRRVFELYGYSPVDTPALERFEILSSKYAGGEEILKETFKVSDQGGRELGLRYDLTVPLARLVAMNPTLKMPFKRYQIEKVWRDGPVQAGRYREFMQCDVDVVGVASMAADAEILALISAALAQLGMKGIIKFNNVKLLRGILDFAGVEKSKTDTVILSLDKLEKLGEEPVKKELQKKGVPKEAIKVLLGIFSITGTAGKTIQELRKEVRNPLAAEGLAEIEEVLSYCGKLDVDATLDIRLARGLSYYTSTVFETFLIGSSIKSSVCSGGRYDRMIGMFLGTERSYPAVGTAFGLDRLYDALLEKEKGSRKTPVVVYVIPIGLIDQAMRTAERLRQDGIATDIDLSSRGVGKSLEYANSQRIPYAVLVGKEELSQKKVKLRNMKSGEEKLVAVEEVKEFLTEKNK